MPMKTDSVLNATEDFTLLVFETSALDYTMLSSFEPPEYPVHMERMFVTREGGGEEFLTVGIGGDEDATSYSFRVGTGDPNQPDTFGTHIMLFNADEDNIEDLLRYFLERYRDAGRL